MNKSALIKRRKDLDARKPVVFAGGSVIKRQFQSLTDGLAVIATENPVEHLHPENKKPIVHVLEMAGCEMRPGNHSIPIVDSHDDTTVHNVFGSLKDISIVGSEFQARPLFASDPESQKIATRYEEGHLTDFSITAETLEAFELSPGRTYTTQAGTLVEGPAIIVSRWRPMNATLCVTGADNYSYVKRSFADQRRELMDGSQMAKLSSMGLPEGVTDPTEILSWLMTKMEMEPVEQAAPVENMSTENPVVENMQQAEAAPAESPVAPVEKVENSMGNQKIERSKQDAELQIKRALDADAARRKEIQAAVKLARIERSFADELCDGFVSVSDARKRIIERMATEPLGTSVGADVRITESADDKFASAVSAGIIMRSHNKASKKLKLEGGQDFVNKPLDEIARECLLRSGAKIERMSRKDVVLAAMGNPRVLKNHNILMRSAYHTTGSFPNILLDAINKSLLAEYEEAPYTWSMWARQAASVPDLKTIYRTRISEFPNLEMVPENAKYPENRMSDSKESYQISKYGAEFTVSWETIINDDLDAISRTTAKMGVAARRTQNALVYSVLTSNPTMGDGNALFSSSHASGDNTSGSAAAPAVATLNAGFLKMRKQTGLNTSAILNIEPRYLIVPVNYEATAMQLLGSFSDPVVGGSAAGNSNTLNIYGPGGQRKNLTLVAEPLLDAASSTNWYLAADPSQVDTVEITFLQGEESPVIDTEEDFDTDTYKYRIRQTMGAKAIDWRGLFRNSA
ncbi:hypothetical protein VN12_19570 [Pirellula sp. SH-Sr6A]|uniref:phage major capsid protein n=1 Tax=Pirellula sp. SH-Sr6A TaxID=1632865 RepID=UPI00078D9953|nr:hypothetical protein [Pirellula sp. SH-Sr6A]AMV30906.1 hypothetical protein VN12_02240 [Pirellula sp. SH-Sr6A]AMV34334.1 hypothetical protein VN12_19570 [Pirellula sp. SH-Sr6A]